MRKYDIYVTNGRWHVIYKDDGDVAYSLHSIHGSGEVAELVKEALEARENES